MAPSVSPAEFPAVTRPPARKGVRSVRQAFEGRLRAEELVALGDLPALVREDAHRDDRPREHAVAIGPRLRRAPLRLRRVPVGRLLRQRRERVVEVLGGLSHDGCALVDEPLRHEPRVEVDVLAHRVVSHVLDTAGDREVAGAHRDLARGGRRRGEGAGAHPVDCEARDRVRQPGEQADVATERQPLVADLRGRGHHDVPDPLGRRRGVAAQQLADDLDAHVVGARLPEEPTRPRLAERGPHPVDEHDLLQLAGHARSIQRR